VGVFYYPVEQRLSLITVSARSRKAAME
jgi:hypothetical protein